MKNAGNRENFGLLPPESRLPGKELTQRDTFKIHFIHLAISIQKADSHQSALQGFVGSLHDGCFHVVNINPDVPGLYGALNPKAMRLSIIPRRFPGWCGKNALWLATIDQINLIQLFVRVLVEVNKIIPAGTLVAKHQANFLMPLLFKWDLNAGG